MADDGDSDFGDILVVRRWWFVVGEIVVRRTLCVVRKIVIRRW